MKKIGKVLDAICMIIIPLIVCIILLIMNQNIPGFFKDFMDIMIKCFHNKEIAEMIFVFIFFGIPIFILWILYKKVVKRLLK